MLLIGRFWSSNGNLVRQQSRDVVGNREHVEARLPVEIDELGRDELAVTPGRVCMELGEKGGAPLCQLPTCSAAALAVFASGWLPFGAVLVNAGARASTARRALGHRGFRPWAVRLARAAAVQASGAMHTFISYGTRNPAGPIERSPTGSGRLRRGAAGTRSESPSTSLASESSLSLSSAPRPSARARRSSSFNPRLVLRGRRSWRRSCMAPPPTTYSSASGSSLSRWPL
jgi:hypothetical protein